MTTRAYAATVLLARQFALGVAGCLAWIVAGCSTPAELTADPAALRVQVASTLSPRDATDRLAARLMDCSYRMGTRVEPLFVTAEDRGRIVMTMSGGGFHAALLVADVTQHPTGSSIALVSQPQWRRYLTPAAAWAGGGDAACPE